MQRQGLGEAISFTTTSGQHILVDAGERGSALRGKLRQPAGAGEWGSALRRKLRERVDVLLLTHNDSDHVGGAPDLLRSGLIREVWLPYDWHLLYSAGTNLVDALQNGDSDLAQVAHEALERVTSAVETLRHDLEGRQRHNLPNDSPPVQRRGLREFDKPLASLNSGIGAKMAIRARQAIGVRWIGGARLTAQGVISGGAPGRRARATVRAVDAVLNWGGPTRWFSIDHASATPPTTDLPWEREGLAGEFTVVNAREIQARPLPPPRTAADAYALLAVLYQLTIQNRRALVALGHTQLGCGHVLFASDSAFEFDQLAGPVVPWSMIGAAVGLHHGSAGKVHDHIYERFGGRVLARSGSRPVLRTHSCFTGVPPKRRGCTWCHADGSSVGGLDRHRDVVLKASEDGDWRVVAGACIDCPRFV
jgi:hypothetical protein